MLLVDFHLRLADQWLHAAFQHALRALKAKQAGRRVENCKAFFVSEFCHGAFIPHYVEVGFDPFVQRINDLSDVIQQATPVFPERELPRGLRGTAAAHHRDIKFWLSRPITSPLRDSSATKCHDLFDALTLETVDVGSMQGELESLEAEQAATPELRQGVQRRKRMLHNMTQRFIARCIKGHAGGDGGNIGGNAPLAFRQGYMMGAIAGHGWIPPIHWSREVIAEIKQDCDRFWREHVADMTPGGERSMGQAFWEARHGMGDGFKNYHLNKAARRFGPDFLRLNGSEIVRG